MDVNYYIQNIELGDHIACIYRTEEEFFKLLIPYLKSGFEKNNFIIYILADQTENEVIAKLKDNGFDITPYIVNKSILFRDYHNIYFKDGEFDEDTSIAFYTNLSKDALSKGFSALRIAGQGTWLATDTQDIDVAMKYESKINLNLMENSIIGLCAYNETLVSPQLLLNVIRTHPNVFLYNKIVESPYFSPSSYFTPVENTESIVEHYRSVVNSLLSEKTQA